jgi:hypothetical protein
MKTQEKINIIASAFGAGSGKKTWKRCRGKYAGTVDYSITFDNGEQLYVCNSVSSRTFERHIDELYEQYHPDTVLASKETALNVLRERSALDNAAADKMNLLPHEVLSVELNTTGKNGRMGWYYVVLRVGDAVIHHNDTVTYYDILKRKLSPNDVNNYYTAGGLRDDEVDYIFNGVGFSSKSPLYKMAESTVFYKMV